MWELRSIEKEIDEDGGVIIFTKEAKILFKEFDSQELVDKIKFLLKQASF